MEAGRNHKHSFEDRTKVLKISLGRGENDNNKYFVCVHCACIKTESPYGNDVDEKSSDKF